MSQSHHVRRIGLLLAAAVAVMVAVASIVAGVVLDPELTVLWLEATAAIGVLLLEVLGQYGQIVTSPVLEGGAPDRVPDVSDIEVRIGIGIGIGIAVGVGVAGPIEGDDAPETVEGRPGCEQTPRGRRHLPCRDVPERLPVDEVVRCGHRDRQLVRPDRRARSEHGA